MVAVVWRRPFVLVQVAVADVVADLGAYGLKEWIDRARPPVTLLEPKALVHVPGDGSFPSGHAATSFACATVLARALPPLALPAFVLAAAIAWSRVYVGVHYPLDVLGGAALGLLVGLGVVWATRHYGRRPATAPRSPSTGPRRSRRARTPG